MRYDLATMARRLGLKRKATVLAPILMTNALANELASISRQIIRPWLESQPRILDAYSRELARKLQMDSTDELSSLFQTLADLVNQLVIDLTPALQTWGVRVEGWHRRKFQDSVLSGANVDVSALIGPTDSIETIDAFMARQTALIRNVSDESRAKIADLVFRSLQQRIPPREVGREISQIIGASRDRSNRIAADQATKLASALDAQRQREAGLTVWQWNHSGKLHPRPWHKARDGNWYADDPADQGKAPNGKAIDAPPPKDDLPGVPPFCGCTRQGILILPE